MPGRMRTDCWIWQFEPPCLELPLPFTIGLKMMNPHPLVQIARQTIEAYLTSGESTKTAISLPTDLPVRAATFVSLHIDGKLRGCIGTLEPQAPTLIEEVERNAIAAAVRDPRFPPIVPAEVPKLEISVDVLTPAQPAQREDLDPRRFGVIVECGRRRGVLLPDLEGVDTVERQLSIACQKANIGPREPYRIYRFEVQRFH
jgi:AmmeMemoRadiSam system protein A